jgi:hypothetical protein
MKQTRFANADKEYAEIKAVQKKLAKLYNKYFPKVDHGLLGDIISNTPSAKESGGRLYELQIITKEGTDPEKMRSFFIERSGKVPAHFEDGTHYLAQEYATLDMIKEIQNLSETEHIMGDYTFGAYAVSQVHRHRGEDEASRIAET